MHGDILQAYHRLPRRIDRSAEEVVQNVGEYKEWGVRLHVWIITTRGWHSVHVPEVLASHNVRDWCALIIIGIGRKHLGRRVDNTNRIVVDQLSQVALPAVLDPVGKVVLFNIPY